MKLSVDRFHEDAGAAWILQALAPALRCGMSFSRRLEDQPFGGITGLLEKAVQRTLGLQDGLHPSLGSCLEMPHEFQHAQLARFLLP
jgi:hypothetical protein